MSFRVSVGIHAWFLAVNFVMVVHAAVTGDMFAYSLGVIAFITAAHSLLDEFFKHDAAEETTEDEE